MPVQLRSDETAAYGFQHPDNGAAMTLKLDDDDRPFVEVDDSALDEATPEEAAHLNRLAMKLTKAVCGMTDLYEAARKLCGAPYHCEDILR